MSSKEIVISVKNLSKYYEIYEQPIDRLKQFLLPRIQKFFGKKPKKYLREFLALNDISFNVKKGETVGIIGKNGSGKSTLLQIICGTLSPTNGVVEITGRVAGLLELGSGFNPEFTGRENVYINAGILGLTKKETDNRLEEIVSFADIGEFIDRPVKTYSSGMYVRLAFSVAVHVDADILIVDEALSVGDAFFQAKCISRMRKIVDSGTTVLFVSHDINSVKALCNRTLWLDHGIGRAFGETFNVSQAYAKDWIKKANAQHLLTDEDVDEEIHEVPTIDNQKDNFKLDRSLRFSERSGTGEAKYLAFQCMSGPDPIGILPLEFGSLLKLKCLIEINESCERLIVAIHIKDSNNQHLVGVNSGMISGLYDRCWKKGERFQVEFTLPVFLHDGRYAITALISSMADVTNYSDVKFIDWLEDVDVFEVSKRDPFPLTDLVEIEHEIKFKIS